MSQHLPLPLRFALSRGSGRDESQGSVTSLAPTASRRLTSLVRLQLRYESQRAAVDPSQGPSARFLVPAHRHQYLDCGDCPLQPVRGDMAVARCRYRVPGRCWAPLVWSSLLAVGIRLFAVALLRAGSLRVTPVALFGVGWPIAVAFAWIAAIVVDGQWLDSTEQRGDLPVRLHHRRRCVRHRARLDRPAHDRTTADVIPPDPSVLRD